MASVPKTAAISSFIGFGEVLVFRFGGEPPLHVKNARAISGAFLRLSFPFESRGPVYGYPHARNAVGIRADTAGKPGVAFADEVSFEHVII